MEPKQRTSVRIRSDAHWWVRMVAADRGATVQDVVDEIMSAWTTQQAVRTLGEPGVAESLTDAERAAIRAVLELQAARERLDEESK